MSERALMAELQPYLGSKLIDYADEIETIAGGLGYSVNVLDPEFNTGSIDNEPTRLNVRTDRQSVITSFTIG